LLKEHENPLFSRETSDSPRQLHVLRHDCHALGVYGAEVAILKKSYKVSLRRLLQGQYRRALPPEGLARHLQLNLPYEAGEGEAAEEQLCGVLISPYLLEGPLS